MAIAPNTPPFVSGTILTAAQMTALPMGIVAYAEVTTATSITTTEAVQITSSAFTAVANRYYKVTYFEPLVQTTGTAPGYIQQFVRLTNLAGAIQGQIDVEPVAATSDGQFMMTYFIKTFTAGSTVLVGTMKTSTNTAQAYGSATYRRFILVEDIGGA